jgi:hypothetical protein
MTVSGTVVNGVIVLDNGHALPEGTRVDVVIPERAEARTTLGQRLLKLAGTAKDLPSDLADQHDHYLHGTPKR